jgi:hypothetical protein
VNVETLRLEYKRLTGREHPPSCEEANPDSPCMCRCNGLLHGITWRVIYDGKANLLKWINRSDTKA